MRKNPQEVSRFFPREVYQLFSDDPLGQYRYFYGSGSEPNREIQFVRDSSGHIKASVQAITPNGTREISTLSDEQISVEMMMRTEKIQALIAKQDIAPPVLISKLPRETQENIIKKLQPRGFWRLSVTNKHGDIDPRFEKVVQVTFFKSK